MIKGVIPDCAAHVRRVAGSLSSHAQALTWDGHGALAKRATAAGVALLAGASLLGAEACGGPHPAPPSPEHVTAPTVAPTPATPAKQHVNGVLVVMLENEPLDQIKGNPNAAFINQKLLSNDPSSQAAFADQYFSLHHPSLPNYLQLEGGTDYGVQDDGYPNVNGNIHAEHLTGELQAQGKRWGIYAGGITEGSCPMGVSGTQGVDQQGAKHIPPVYFSDTADPAVCDSHSHAISTLQNDLNDPSFGGLNYVIPTLCDDGHDQCASGDYNRIGQIDAFVKSLTETIKTTRAYQNGLVVEFVFDEGIANDQRVMCVFVSTRVKPGYTSEIHFDETNLTATNAKLVGVAPPGDAKNATDMADLFQPNVDLNGPGK